MTTRTRLLLASCWILSLVVVAAWSARAQEPTAPGVEVRFVRGQGTGGGQAGILVANVDGQWLPVELDTMPAAPDFGR